MRKEEIILELERLKKAWCICYGQINKCGYCENVEKLQ